MALPCTGSWLSFLVVCVMAGKRLNATIKPRDNAGLLEFTIVYGKVQIVFRLSDSFLTKYCFPSACLMLWLIHIDHSE